jgi:hypothetical protein
VAVNRGNGLSPMGREYPFETARPEAQPAGYLNDRYATQTVRSGR